MNQERLTPKQKETLLAFSKLLSEQGKAPTLDEIRIEVGAKHISGVQRHVDALKSKGYLDSSRHKARSLVSKLSNSISFPLVGSVACGTPLLAEENVEAMVSYSGSKAKTGDFFFLRASGDSMNEAGIDDGDLILIKQQQSADTGQRIVALIGEEATVKELGYENGFPVLYPKSTNVNHRKIVVTDNLDVQGVVIDVLKPAS